MQERYIIYHNTSTAKELPKKLENKYIREDVSTKKILLSHFNSYKIYKIALLIEQNLIFFVNGCFINKKSSYNLKKQSKKSRNLILPKSWR